MNRLLLACVLAALFAACAAAFWRSRPANKPLTRSELSSRYLSIADQGDDPALHAAFVRALASEGFTVVAHPPYHGDLEVTLAIARAPGGAVAVATLRSDGFFVDEARALFDGSDSAPSALARTLAVSQGTAEFVRNSGTPQQQNFSSQ